MNEVVDFINVNRDRYVDELKQYLAIPSVSALPQHQADVRRAAEWSADHMRHIGLEHVRLEETPGNPIVYGDWLNAEGAPTILFYGHYDVQPVDPVELWESPPFDATVRENEIYAREIPSICYGLRGLVYYQIDLRGTKTDLHSGAFGGAMANPAFVLGQVLAQMKDKSGRVKITGFYDDVRQLTEAERAEWKKLPFDEKKYRKEWGAPKLSGESGYTVLERVWGRPTFEVNGLLSGFTGEGPKTVLPAVAMAKVSMRLVPDQDPDKIAKQFEEYVQKVAPASVELKLTRLHGGKPWMAEFDSPFIRA